MFATRGIAILHEQDMVAHLHRITHRRLAAAVRSSTSNNQRVNPPSLQELVKIARARDEGAPSCLRHDQVLGLNVEAGPQGMLLCADAERRLQRTQSFGGHTVVVRSPMVRLLGIDLVLDVGNRPPRRPQR